MFRGFPVTVRVERNSASGQAGLAVGLSKTPGPRRWLHPVRRIGECWVVESEGGGRGLHSSCCRWWFRRRSPG